MSRLKPSLDGFGKNVLDERFVLEIAGFVTDCYESAGFQLDACTGAENTWALEFELAGDVHLVPVPPDMSVDMLVQFA